MPESRSKYVKKKFCVYRYWWWYLGKGTKAARVGHSHEAHYVLHLPYAAASCTLTRVSYLHAAFPMHTRGVCIEGGGEPHTFEGDERS